MTTYVYQKRCKICKEIYYKKFIAKVVYDAFLSSVTLELTQENDTKIATITSLCELHFNKLT